MKLVSVLVFGILLSAGAFTTPAAGFHEAMPPVLHESTASGSAWYAAVVDVPRGGDLAFQLSASGGRGPVQLGFHVASVDDAINWTEVVEAWRIGESIESRGYGRLPGSTTFIGGGPDATSRASLHVHPNRTLEGPVRVLAWTSGGHESHEWTLRGSAGTTIVAESSGTRTFLFTLNDFDRVTRPADDVPVVGGRILVDAEHAIQAQGALFASFHKLWSCGWSCPPTVGTLSWEGPSESRRAPADGPLALPDPASAAGREHLLANGTGQDDALWITAGASGDHAFRLHSAYVGDDRFLLGGADVTLPAWP